MDVTGLQESIAQGENLRREFKRWPVRSQDMAAALVAFANSSGGQLLLGIDNNGAIRGVADPDEAMQQVDNIAYNNCEPPVEIHQEKVEFGDGNTAIVVNVPRGEQRPYRTNSGIYYIRTNTGRRQATRQELLRLFQAAESLYYDETPIHRATIDDLDRRAVQTFFEETRGFSWETAGLSFEQVLINLRLAQAIDGVLRPTLAGILVFGYQPQHFVPHAYISALRIPGTSLANDPSDQKRIDGPALRLLEDAMRFLYIHLPVPHRIRNLEPEAQPELPAVALREVLINAIAHRDYTIQGPVRILIFDDRVEVRSPGQLPNSVTLESLQLGVHVLRNPTIYNFFLRLAMVTDAGSGILRVISRVKEETGRLPVWKVEGNEVVVILYRSMGGT
jgi:ATP-dependent DNA helicase RecG